MNQCTYLDIFWNNTILPIYNSTQTTYSHSIASVLQTVTLQANSLMHKQHATVQSKQQITEINKTLSQINSALVIGKTVKNAPQVVHNFIDITIIQEKLKKFPFAAAFIYYGARNCQDAFKQFSLIHKSNRKNNRADFAKYISGLDLFSQVILLAYVIFLMLTASPLIAKYSFFAKFTHIILKTLSNLILKKNTSILCIPDFNSEKNRQNALKRIIKGEQKRKNKEIIKHPIKTIAQPHGLGKFGKAIYRRFGRD